MLTCFCLLVIVLPSLLLICDNLFLIDDGIGIDGEQNVAQLIDVAGVVSIELPQVLNEVIVLSVIVLVGIGMTSITQIVSDVVVGVEPVSLNDAAVNDLGHFLVVFIARQGGESHKFNVTDRLADLKVHTALSLHDTRQNTIEVLTRLLGVLRKLRGIELQCL